MSKSLRSALIVSLVSLLSGCGDSKGGLDSVHERSSLTDDKVLNIYNWSDFIGARTIAEFEAKTGIKVVYDTYDSNEVLETKLLTGNTGYDIVVPAGNFLTRQANAGALLKLDKSQLPNLSHMDPEIMDFAADHDPGNQYGIAYVWGTTGIGYNPDLVERVLGTRTIDSWSVLFDPSLAAKLSTCGIAMLDASEDVFEAARIYMGREPNSESGADLAASEALLRAVRRYVRYFHSSQYINDLASGEICVAIGWSGDVLQARARGASASKPVQVEYAIPSEGATIWFALMAIPADAPHPGNAHAFLNYLMDPQVIADISNELGTANGNADATPYLRDSLRDDPVIYPSAEVRGKLHRSLLKSQEFSRLQNRAWTRVKAGQ